ncbi:MAG: glycosyltransferase family A protein [Anaerolineae bacterium]
MSTSVNERALVTIVVPCYNQGHYLACALESIVAQTWPRWEAIVIDDGSTDSTASVVRAFAGDSRIHYVYQVNSGVSAARNTGIRNAQGRYLAFLDADDAFEQTFLESCLQVLETNPDLGAVYTGFVLMDATGVAVRSVRLEPCAESGLWERLLEGGFFPPCAVMARKAAIESVGGFDRELSGVADWDMWLRLSRRYAVHCTPDALVRYRAYSGSMSTNPATMHADCLRALAKHFGPAEDRASTWSEEKRLAYAHAHRATCIGYLQAGQPDAARDHLVQAAAICPRILARLDTYYELACGDQERTFRGTVVPSDVETYGARMLSWLSALYDGQSRSPLPHRRRAYGQAHLALGMLYDQAGDWAAAGQHLLQAARADRALLASPAFLRRLLKVLAGKRLVALARRMCSGAGMRAAPGRTR